MFHMPARKTPVATPCRRATGRLSASALRRGLLHRSRQLTLSSPWSLGQEKTCTIWFSGDSRGSRNRRRMSLLACLKSMVVECVGASAFFLIEFARPLSWPLVLNPPSTRDIRLQFNGTVDTLQTPARYDDRERSRQHCNGRSAGVFP